ncbi:MAG: alpha/beta fold hydrolase [Actinobacteria bacterium]|nr:alpha/beta fold hydrolase [Actinomycetota bacterium]
MSVLPGAEPFHHDGGRVGVVLCHGFTGTPQSLRDWGVALAAAGYTVRLPLLPGHGTRWQDMNTTTWADWYGAVDAAFTELRASCDQVFVMGLSMGGGLALRLAEEHGDDVAGVVVVNPSVAGTDWRMTYLLPWLRHVVPAFPGVASDIKKSGPVELAYDRSPLHAAYSLTRLWQVVAADLPKVTQPLVVLRSAEDHIVPAASGELVMAKAGSTDKTEIVLHDSYHVATLDNDADLIVKTSLAFVERVLASSPGRAQ